MPSATFGDHPSSIPGSACLQGADGRRFHKVRHFGFCFGAQACEIGACVCIRGPQFVSAAGLLHDLRVHCRCDFVFAAGLLHDLRVHWLRRCDFVFAAGLLHDLLRVQLAPQITLAGSFCARRS